MGSRTYYIFLPGHPPSDIPPGQSPSFLMKIVQGKYAQWEMPYTHSMTDISNEVHVEVWMQGVRFLFTTEGQLINALDQLVDGGSYVCSSTMSFRRLDYEAIQSPTWIKQFKAKIKGIGEFGPDDDLSPRDFIVPRTICVFCAGPRPRNRVKMLLNRRTAHTYDQLLTDIAHAVHVSCAIKCIYTTSGRQVGLSTFCAIVHH